MTPSPLDEGTVPAARRRSHVHKYQLLCVGEHKELWGRVLAWLGPLLRPYANGLLVNGPAPLSDGLDRWPRRIVWRHHEIALASKPRLGVDAAVQRASAVGQRQHLLQRVNVDNLQLPTIIPEEQRQVSRHVILPGAMEASGARCGQQTGLLAEPTLTSVHVPVELHDLFVEVLPVVLRRAVVGHGRHVAAQRAVATRRAESHALGALVGHVLDLR
mmetsp:Transcript_33204/g.95805  ORF Transcript_33204/g.95805 Transcript_33204/m.95805 type:complete len:216 (-) Transcript_33204:272-919(-)